MSSEVNQLPVPLYHSASGAFEAPYMMASAEAMIGEVPPGRSASGYAVRNMVRSAAVGKRGMVLQRCAGVAMSMAAWIVVLLGLAHFVIAAMHNREGELGLGLDATMMGARICLLGGALAGIGVPLWVSAERRLRDLAGAFGAPADRI